LKRKGKEKKGARGGKRRAEKKKVGAGKKMGRNVEERAPRWVNFISPQKFVR